MRALIHREQNGPKYKQRVGICNQRGRVDTIPIVRFLAVEPDPNAAVIVRCVDPDDLFVALGTRMRLRDDPSRNRSLSSEPPRNPESTNEGCSMPTNRRQCPV